MYLKVVAVANKPCGAASALITTSVRSYVLLRSPSNSLLVLLLYFHKPFMAKIKFHARAVAEDT